MRGGRTGLPRHPARIESSAGVLLRLRLPDVSESATRAEYPCRGAGASVLPDEQSCAPGGGAKSGRLAGGAVPEGPWPLRAVPEHAPAAQRAPVAAAVFLENRGQPACF